MAVLIRAATPADLEAVWAIDREVFAPEPYPRFFFRQAHDLWGGLLRVVQLPSGELAGYALGAVGARRDEGWILAAAVRPGHRGRGIATRLTRDLLEALAAHDLRTVLLTVHPDNLAALRLYRRLGFRAAAQEEGYFGPGEPRVLMRLELRRPSPEP